MHGQTQLFATVLAQALQMVEDRSLPVFTFALYHDHESAAVSVCVDTRANSRQVVHEMNAYNMRYFLKAVEAGDLRTAQSWQANIGRSLSLGDFAAVNLARTDIDGLEPDDDFYRAMVAAMVACHDHVRAVSEDPDSTVLACSGPDDEVALVWSLPPVLAPSHPALQPPQSQRGRTPGCERDNRC